MFFKKKAKENEQSSDITRSHDLGKMKERLFFHDLVNLTHGVLLFLDKKEVRAESLNSEEIRMIKKEIKTLQSLVRDHYNYKHKNLHQTYEWMSFSEVGMAFEGLVHTYLSHMDVSVNYQISGADPHESLIYYPAYYRILNNVIKNIAESKASKVSFTFTLNAEGFYLETKNEMQKSQKQSEDLARMILDEKSKPVKSLGLDSIHHLAEESKGHFSFEIYENSWVNRLYLPVQKNSSKNTKISAA